MNCKYSLLFLFLCGFAALSVSTKTCGKELREGTSCTIKLKTKNNEKPTEIKWAHLSSDAFIEKKRGKIKNNKIDGEIDEEGSLTFKSVSLKDTGRYKYTAFNSDGTEIGAGEEEIKVYANASKPTVKDSCNNGKATVTCNIGDSTDLTVSWYKEGKIIENENKPEILLTSAQVQENKPYSCRVSNPVSSEQSDSFTVTCTGTGGTSDGSGGRKLFGFDFWIMVSILAGGGSLLLLLICVLIICACRSCKKQKKLEQDEDELRLRVFHDPASNGTARSKNTARGQPAPPIPQEDTSPDTPPPQTQTQPKAQIRARPPPPPEDNDEYPPPLPRPRNKQHRKRNEEPYRPME